jgi:hypothetical protein
LSNNSPPPLLYKYLAPTRVDVLGSLRVAFSTFAALNDPFEFLIRFDDNAIHERDDTVIRQGYTLENLVTVLREQPSGERLLEEMRALDGPDLRAGVSKMLEDYAGQSTTKARALLDATKGRYREFRDGGMVVFCCSANPLSVPMWAHYTAHEGFQIGFRPAEMFRFNGQESRTTSPLEITYHPEPPIVGADFSTIADCASRKMSDWAYESEWRYFSNRPLDFESPVPGIYLYPFNPMAVAEITFGIRAKDDFVAIVKRNTMHAGIQCRYFRVVSDNNSYQLKRDDC